jgi:hypothetical protein
VCPLRDERQRCDAGGVARELLHLVTGGDVAHAYCKTTSNLGWPTDWNALLALTLGQFMSVGIKPFSQNFTRQIAICSLFQLFCAQKFLIPFYGKSHYYGTPIAL